MSNTYSAVSTLWILFGTVMIFFMQAGFSLVESGFTRAKNAGNTVMKNLLDFCISSCLFWFIGFGFMFGKGNSFIGWFDFIGSKNYSHIVPETLPLSVFIIWQTMFCGIASTLFSGALAERTKFRAYCILSAILSVVVYPIAGHWVWGNGWLKQLGFMDFAGGSIIHTLGGTAALVGLLFLGARIGKYDKTKKALAIPGHNLTVSGLGIFILWFCWFGYAASAVGGIHRDTANLIGNIFLNTNLSAAISTCTVMLYTKARYGKTDVSMTLNAALAGLVASSAGCGYIEPVGAAIIGVLTGLLLVPVLELLDRKFLLDDPVGVITVHGFCGALGTIFVGLFSTEKGLFYGGGFRQLLIQLVGVAAVIVWTGLVMGLAFFVLKQTDDLRVSADDELTGLDLSEHGLESAYADFSTSKLLGYGEYTPEVSGSVPPEKAVPVTASGDYTPSSNKLTKVEIIMKQERFEALKTALNEVGITGMTVTHVLGCGMQKGRSEYYRGIEMDMQLLPKICVSIVLAKVPVEAVVAAARRVLYTGHIGDGKIFVFPVENAIKIRTGEQGYDAMQGKDE